MFGPRPGSHPWRARADPNLKTQWAAQHRPCARCGEPIAYDQPYWLRVAGRTVMNPRAYVEGHIVSLAHAQRFGWTRAQANHPGNKQPECAACSRSSGARQGQRLQSLGRRRRVATLDDSRAW